MTREDIQELYRKVNEISDFLQEKERENDVTAYWEEEGSVEWFNEVVVYQRDKIKKLEKQISSFEEKERLRSVRNGWTIAIGEMLSFLSSSAYIYIFCDGFINTENHKWINYLVLFLGLTAWILCVSYILYSNSLRRNSSFL